MNGNPRLRLLVRPEVGLVDPQAVAAVFLQAIGDGAQGRRVMALTAGFYMLMGSPPSHPDPEDR